MSVENYLDELTQKHRILDEKIEIEVARPGSSDQEVRRLKQEKLRLRDQIERLRETQH